MSRLDEIEDLSEMAEYREAINHEDICYLLRIARAAERLADSQDAVSAVGATLHVDGDEGDMEERIIKRDVDMDALRAALEGREP